MLNALIEFSLKNRFVVLLLAGLLVVAGVEADYKALSEAGRVALLRSELASPRPLTSPFATYSEETQSELAIARAVRPDRVRLAHL